MFLCCKFSKLKFMKIYVLVVGSFSKLNRRTINRNLTKMEINGQKLRDGLKCLTFRDIFQSVETIKCCS